MLTLKNVSRRKLNHTVRCWLTIVTGHLYWQVCSNSEEVDASLAYSPSVV